MGHTRYREMRDSHEESKGEEFSKIDTCDLGVEQAMENTIEERKQEEYADLGGQVERYDSNKIVHAPDLHHEFPLFEDPLKAQSLDKVRAVEHKLMGSSMSVKCSHEEGVISSLICGDSLVFLGKMKSWLVTRCNPIILLMLLYCGFW